jgi:hypothetical protein
MSFVRPEEKPAIPLASGKQQNNKRKKESEALVESIDDQTKNKKHQKHTPVAWTI